MVKLFLSFVILFSTTFLSAVELDPQIDAKIKSFLDDSTYNENKKFIEILFDPPREYFLNERVNSVKVIQTLKENGLLKLFFASPKELHLNFKTSASPLFFVKIMEDTLRNIGYYRYITTSSHLDASEFIWDIALTSEYVTDPIILDRELSKSGCSILDIQRDSLTEWTYTIDMSNAHLNVHKLDSKDVYNLRHSLDANWLDISAVSKLKIESSIRNKWYPYIAYYDSSLHLLELFKQDKVTKKIILNIPKNAKYIKITDAYTIKNIKDELILKPISSR